ncbi:MAG: GNAT family protein [Nitriliruptor sp.]|uniref:GNAT family N-acetyltransferase n=1 Tax=Nitriliruptor sp. TaxID=2448056 RepID=UPI00349FF19E
MPARHEVHLRVLTSEDAAWAVELDASATSAYARDHGWDSEKLAAEIDEGVWTSDDRFAWAIVVDGDPGGFALVTGLAEADARMEIRIAAPRRGRGVGREVLRQLADHHFAANPHLVRLAGRAHEHNVPMQRAFNAAGFRMEARYRDSFQQTDGALASEWGYALTRTDWEAGRHRGDEKGYDLHGLTFAVEETIEGPPSHGVLVKFLQESRRIIARYDGHEISEGELAGLLVGDVLVYHFVHLVDEKGAAQPQQIVGHGRARMQRRRDGRLEAVDEWDTTTGVDGRRLLVERRDDQR